jgi:hypothetical protein
VSGPAGRRDNIKKKGLPPFCSGALDPSKIKNAIDKAIGKLSE